VNGKTLIIKKDPKMLEIYFDYNISWSTSILITTFKAQRMITGLKILEI